MSDFVRSFQLGSARITVINIGDIYLPLAANMNVPKDQLSERADLRELAEQTLIPIQFIHIQLPHTSVLVDAGVYDVVTDPEYALPGYQPPPGLVDRLLEQNLSLAAVDKVIITHSHWDHFNGTTIETASGYSACFPNARYYLGRPDWERVAQKLPDPQSVEYRTLKVLNDKGVLQLVDGDLDLGNGLQIIAAPGETPGHQIVRVHSEGETLYCLGDVYHHLVEIIHPEWQVSSANSETLGPSRSALVKRALAEQALLISTHIPVVGRLKATTTGVSWESIY